MSYQRILESVAAMNNTTPDEVDKEMRKAISEAGYDIEPAAFISLVTEKVKKTMYRNWYNISSISFS